MLVSIPGFEVLRLLGKGGMGEVYEARDTRTDRPAAVKVLAAEHVSPTGRSRFEREARAMLSVDHPHVCTAYDYGSLDDGRLYLAMELLQGEDLGARLKRKMWLSTEAAVEMVMQVASALGRTHSRGVLHRDIKPSNLFLVDSPDGVVDVQVLDFGLAVSSGQEDLGRVTRTGEIVGTPAYMSPEQARGERELDERTDIYSLGAVLYHLLTGRPPHGTDAPLAILVRMLTEPVASVRSLRPGVPKELDAFVGRMLARSPEDRPRTMAEVERALGLIDPAEMNLSAEEELALANTDAPPGDTGELVTERRLLTALVAAGVDELDKVVAAIRAQGGQPVEVGSREVVGLFGAEELEGDEALRAVTAAQDVQDICRVIGVSTRWSGLSSESGAVESAWAATVQLGRGVTLDEETRTRVGSRASVHEGRVQLISGVTPVREVSLPFMGRDADLATLVAKAEQVFDEEEREGMILVGPPGVGKTRLVRELRNRLRETTSVQAVYCGAEPHRRYSSWHTIGASLRDMGGLSEDAPNDRAREVMRALASEAGLDPDVGDLLAVTLGVPLEGRNPALEHAQRDPQVMRDQMFSALGDFFEAKAALRPLLLVIEDVQWADTPSVECIDVLLRRAERCSLFVVVTARPHALEDRKDLLQSGLLTEHVVRDLSNKAARRLVAEALVQHGVIGFSESVSDAIAEHAGGNPFFISEIVGSIAVRYLKDGMEGFDPDAFALPMTVEGAVMSRLDHLEGGAKDLVKRASVLGIRFWSEALGELGCKSPAHTIRKLVRTGLVVRPARRDVRLSGFDEYGFRQRVVRDVAYGILTPDQRRVLHLAAGRWLSSVEAALPEETAGHLEKGGDTQAAAEWWARAAEAALARGDTRMSFEWFDRAVSGMTDPQRVTELRLKKVEGYYAANDFRGAESELAQIDVDVLKPALRVMARYWKCRIVMDSAVARDSRGDAVREMMDIAAEFESLEMAYWHGMALAKAALTSHYLDLSPGLPLAEKALEVGGNYPAVEAVSWDAIAMVHMYDDALDKAVHASREAAKAARRGGMLGMEVALLGDIAWIAGQLGRFDESKEALLEVMERSARFGNKRTAAYALHNLGLVHLNQGDLEQALEVEERALAMAHAGQNDRLVAYCRVYRAFILLALGRPDEASRSSTAALAFAKGTELEAAARTALAASLVEKGEVEAAALESSRAEELRQESGRMVEFGVELTLVRCSVLEASGDLKAARKLLGHAQSQVLERAQRLTDKKEERDVFLAIPAHQRLLALAS